MAEMRVSDIALVGMALFWSIPVIIDFLLLCRRNHW